MVNDRIRREMFDYCVGVYSDMIGIYGTHDWHDPRCKRLLYDCAEYVLSHGLSENEFKKMWKNAVDWYDDWLNA